MAPARNCWKRVQSFSVSSGGEKSTQCLLRNSSSLKPSIEQKAGFTNRDSPSKFSTAIPIGLLLKTSRKSCASSVRVAISLNKFMKHEASRSSMFSYSSKVWALGTTSCEKDRANHTSLRTETGQNV